jgi:hypothetical protein
VSKSSTKDLLALTEGILNSTPSVKEVVAVGADRIVDDGLKAVAVPDEFVNQVLGFNNALNESSDPVKKQEMMPKFTPINEELVLKQKLQSLVENLKELLREAKVVIQEATTCGMLSTGPSKPLGRGDNTYPPVSKKTHGSNKRNKRNKGY